MSAKIGFGFPRGLGLNPCPVFRGCQFLSLKPVMAGGIIQTLIDTKLQFCCSWNLEKFYRFCLRLISVSFLRFQSYFGVASSFLMKSSFCQNQIFNKKGKSYDSFFLVFCLIPFVADITFIILLWSKIYVCATSCWLLQCAQQKLMTSAKGLAYFKNLFYKCYKTHIFKVALRQGCFKLN